MIAPLLQKQNLEISPMTQILGHCDLKSILNLRKTCHDLRNFIDDTPFQTDIEDISINYTQESLNLDIFSKSRKNNHIRLEYHNSGVLLLEEENQEPKTFPLENPDQFFFEDFQTIFNLSRRNVLNQFNFCLRVPSEFLEKILSMLPAIKAKKINLNTTFQSEIIQFLSRFDSNFLENITISYSKREDLSREIIEMEQWKKAKMVNFDGFTMGILDDLMDFEGVETWCDEEVGYEDVVKIREKFLQSRSLTSLCLWLHHPISPAIFGQFGMNYQDRVSHDYGTTRVWYYLNQDSDQILCQELGETLLRFYFSGNVAPEKLNVL